MLGTDVTPQKFSLLGWFAKNPVVGAASALAGIVSIPLAIILFFAAEKHRAIKFTISDSPTMIVRSGQSSDLRVYFKDAELRSDVSSIQLAIWNSGNESVRRENILSKTVTFRFSSGPVLLVRAKNTTHPYSNFQIDDSAISKGVIKASWDILEGGDGVLLNVIYLGDVQHVSAEGSIEGKLPIERVPIGKERENDTWPLIVGGILGAAIAFVLEVLERRGAKPEFTDSSHPRLALGISFCSSWIQRFWPLAFALLVIIKIAWNFMAPSPPFSF